jgi:hypothetical protein
MSQILKKINNLNLSTEVFKTDKQKYLQTMSKNEREDIIT